MSFARLTCSLAVAIPVGAIALATPLATAQERTVRIGTEAAYAPWNLTNEAGEIVGFEIDLGNAICALNNWECVWVAHDWDGIFPALNQGRFDAIMTGASITAERDEVLDFSIPYMDSHNYFATADADLAARLDGLDKPALMDAVADLIIGTQRGTLSQNFLEQQIEGINLRTYDTLDTMNLDLVAGRLDLGFADIMSYQGFNARGADDIIIFGPSFIGAQHPALGQGTAVVLREGDDELRQGFSDAICVLANDGTITEFSLEWFGFDTSVPCER